MEGGAPFALRAPCVSPGMQRQTGKCALAGQMVRKLIFTAMLREKYYKQVLRDYKQVSRFITNKSSEITNKSADLLQTSPQITNKSAADHPFWQQSPRVSSN